MSRAIGLLTNVPAPLVIDHDRMKMIPAQCGPPYP